MLQLFDCNIKSQLQKGSLRDTQISAFIMDRQVQQKLISMADIALHCWLGTSSICCFDNGVTTRVCCSIAASHSICSARLFLPPSCQLAALPIIFLFIWQLLFLRRSRSRLELSLTSFHPQLFISSLLVFQFFSLILFGLTLPSAGGRVLQRKKYSHHIRGTFLTFLCHWICYRWPLSHPSSAFWLHYISSSCVKGRRLIVMDLSVNPELLPESCTRAPGGQMLFRVSDFSLHCLMVKPWRCPIMAISSYNNLILVSTFNNKQGLLSKNSYLTLT